MAKDTIPSIKDFKIKDNILVKYKGKGGDVVIPDGVVEIGKKAFFQNRSITSVVIPAGCKVISGWAFSGCLNLMKVDLPASLTKVGYDAFSYCRVKSVFARGRTTKEAKELLRPAYVINSEAIKGEHKTYAVKFEFTKKMEATREFDVNSAAKAKKAFDKWIAKYQDPSSPPQVFDVKVVEVQEV